ncbi:MAG: hypothetical protein WAS21_28690, partial [Geminicoccaceae bacterium]
AQSEAGAAALSALAVSLGAGDPLSQLNTLARGLLAPVVTIPAQLGNVDATNTVDLAPFIQDPSGYGYEVQVTDEPPGLSVSVAGSVLTYSGLVEAGYDLGLSINGLHPLQPRQPVTVRIRLELAADRWPNGFRFRRRINRLALAGAPGSGTLAGFVLPLRIGASWAADVAHGGQLRGGAEPDFQVERLDGTVLPISVRPGYDQAAGTGVVDVAVDWDPGADLPPTYLYYGKSLEAPVSDPARVWQDYVLVREGGASDRNPANPALPWSSADLAVALGLLGDADDYADDTAFVQTPDAGILGGAGKLDLLISYKGTGTGNQRGLLGAGDLTSDATARMALRNAKSSTAPSNTLRFFVETTGGRVNWRSAADRQSTSWQVFGLTWQSGAAPAGYLDGAPEANSWPTPPATPIVGDLSLSGALVLGLATGGSVASGFGPWGGLIDEVRIGTAKARTARWRYAESASLNDDSFVTFGAEEAPGSAIVIVTAADDEVTVPYVEGGAALIDVLANDRREPAGPLTVTVPTITSGGGSVSVDSNKLRWAYPTGFSGVGEGGYVASDGLGNTAPAIWRARVASIHNWTIPFPNVGGIDKARVREWRNGDSAPSGYAVGDILLMLAEDDPIDKLDMNFDLLGHFVCTGQRFEPRPVSTLYAPYDNTVKGCGVMAGVEFKATARSHALWEGRNWPIYFFHNNYIDWAANKCCFGDFMKVTQIGATANDSSYAFTGPKASVWWQKNYVANGPCYVSDNINAAFTPPKTEQQDGHADGIQVMGGVPILRVADCHIKMGGGQTFFLGKEAEICGFPRSTRWELWNTVLVHQAPWDSRIQVPTSGTGLARFPKFIMGYEGPATLQKPKHESTDYATGKYVATKFMSQCWVQTRWASLTTAEKKIFLGPTNGVDIDADGNFTFDTAIKTSHTYPIYAGLLKFLAAGATTPTVVDPAHTGPAAGFANKAAFFAAIGLA